MVERSGHLTLAPGVVTANGGGCLSLDDRTTMVAVQRTTPTAYLCFPTVRLAKRSFTMRDITKLVKKAKRT